MPDIKALAAAMQQVLPDILADAERAVMIDSGSYDAAGVNRVQDLWASILRETGFAVERAELPGFGDQLTARLALGNGPRVLVLGHADTVWPAGTVAEWPFRRDGDRITGPGVGDMKTAVVMAMHAIRVLLGRGLTGLGSITFLTVPDEEIGSPGSRAWIEAEARNADLCLTLEPARPGGGTVIGRGAIGAVYVRARGIEAHCGAAREKGASAIAAIAPMIAEIEALSDFEGGSYATAGIFRGGKARQVVPNEADIHFDLRAADDAAADALLAQLRAIAMRPPADPRVTVEVTGGFTRPAFPVLPAMHALYALAEDYARTLDVPIFSLVSRGGSDGAFAARLGVPTLDGLGPIGHDICSRSETAEVSSIIPRATIFAGLIAAAAEGRIPPRGA